MVARIGEIISKWPEHAKAIWFKDILDFSPGFNHRDGMGWIKRFAIWNNMTCQCHIWIYSRDEHTWIPSILWWTAGYLGFDQHPLCNQQRMTFEYAWMYQIYDLSMFKCINFNQFTDDSMMIQRHHMFTKFYQRSAGWTLGDPHMTCFSGAET